MPDKHSAQHKESYKGPGKLFSTLGGFFVGGLAGRALSLPFSVGGISEAASALEGKKSLNSAIALFSVAGIVSLSSAIIGAVKGYSMANAGEQQFRDMRHERDRSEDRANLLSEEAFSERGNSRRFTDTISPRGKHYDKDLTAEADAETSLSR